MRQRFGFRCGYCGVSEVDTGGELTIDHYRPVSAGGSDEDDNLAYACFRCNGYKANFWPTLDELTRGLRILHPMRDNWDEHLREDGTTGTLLPQTDTGRFHLELLQLNRPVLVQHRLHRRFIAGVVAERSLIRVEMEQLRRRVADLQAVLEVVLRRLPPP
ncbi:MAG: HNH endonuclease [Chloroflexota bacterium]